MKSFLKNCLYFGLPMLALLIAVGFMADGYTDPFYLKCTTPPQTSMIIGISRAGQGLQPAIFDSALAKEYPHIHMYNFAFTLHWSSFGRVYFDAITKKLEKNTRDGVFIVTVDPWSIANFKDEPDDVEKLRENSSGFGQTKWMTMKPNYAYLANAYAHPYMSVLTSGIKTRLLNTRPYWLLHDDGWLEVSRAMDSASVAERFQNTVNIYTNDYLAHGTISAVRKLWLLKTIAFLKEHGDVYLVRLPVHPTLMAFDNKFYPRFDSFMDSVARQQNIPYFSFSDSCARYTYIDASHLVVHSAAQVSKELCRLIVNSRHLH